MTFFVLGLIAVIFGIYYYRMSKKSGNGYGTGGSILIIIVGLILMIIFGLYYRSFLS